MHKQQGNYRQGYSSPLLHRHMIMKDQRPCDERNGAVRQEKKDDAIYEHPPLQHRREHDESPYPEDIPTDEVYQLMANFRPMV